MIVARMEAGARVLSEASCSCDETVSLGEAEGLLEEFYTI
jgi:hypothetical protein